MSKQELMVVSREMILALKTSHCAGIVVDKEAYIALMELAEKQQPVAIDEYQFNWPPTSAELTGMDRFCGGPSHEDYDASVYKGWLKPKVDALISQLNQVTALYVTYKDEVVNLQRKAATRINTSDPVGVFTISPDERAKFETYAREKGLSIDVAIWNMSYPPQFKEYVDPEAQAAWVHWQEIRSR